MLYTGYYGLGVIFVWLFYFCYITAMLLINFLFRFDMTKMNLDLWGGLFRFDMVKMNLDLWGGGLFRFDISEANTGYGS